jgi:hypothetical protein
MKIDPGNFAACLAAISARGRLGAKEALDLLEEVAERGEEMRRTGTGDPFVAAAFELAGKLKDRARLDRLDAVRNASARGTWTGRALAEAQGRIAPGISANLVPTNRLTLADGLRSVLHWMPGAMRKDNVQSMWHDLEGRLIAPLGNRLRQAGLLKAAQADGWRNEVAEALWRRNGGTQDPGVTIGREAQRMADAFAGPLDLIKARQNAEGAHIGTAVDYVTHTNWDPRQLRLAAGPGKTIDEAFAAWRAKDGPRIAEATFADLVPRAGETMAAARERFLRSVFEATESGVHMRGPALAGMASDGGGFIPPVYEGTHNIGRSVSQPRVVTWKSSRDWADHMRDFGGGESLYPMCSGP